ncbi:sterol desaturase family protein [Marinomonas foliarum]|uniref:Sterol desaturase/sphingolipid hydroxylase (Fatty acid hydroxylase superfamily) n=1 Tax=Marinomonas foliarum TaxID=491950 RepID=A0A369AGN5_9GAMM|nr:sterol desaturase family protein [Marinomonas foliarum]RCX07518.1 sterol desaturase/sphingolipid hydroxylase (fatty acid hydroxylase superfamily) [Marinomonas foliarum]
MIDFTVRIGVFFLAFSVLVLWQWLRPRSPLLQWRQRWRHNVCLFALGTLCVRVIQPLLLSVIAFFSTEFGVLWWLGLPFWAVFLLSILWLDCLIYWQHRLFHRIPILWRIHRVHHSDPELDVSSAVRFHPIEIVLSLFIKGLAVWLLGVPVEAVLAFDILLNASAMFNHTNVRLPVIIEVWTKKLLVTPDMHRIHHSRVSLEANSNYGFFLSIWDALFRSKRNNALEGDEHLKIGLPDTKTYQPTSLKDVLVMPFAVLKKHR